MEQEDKGRSSLPTLIHPPSWWKMLLAGCLGGWHRQHKKENLYQQVSSQLVFLVLNNCPKAARATLLFQFFMLLCVHLVSLWGPTSTAQPYTCCKSGLKHPGSVLSLGVETWTDGGHRHGVSQQPNSSAILPQPDLVVSPSLCCCQNQLHWSTAVEPSAAREAGPSIPSAPSTQRQHQPHSKPCKTQAGNAQEPVQSTSPVG